MVNAKVNYFLTHPKNNYFLDVTDLRILNPSMYINIILVTENKLLSIIFVEIQQINGNFLSHINQIR